MAGLVTKETNRSVDAFIEAVDSPSKNADSYEIVKLIEEVTGLKPKVWGNEKVPDFLIGFGNYNYTRKGGKEVFEWFKVGFALRKTKITIYLTSDLSKQDELLNKLGKCKWGSGCLYVNKLDDINPEVLRELVRKSV